MREKTVWHVTVPARQLVACELVVVVKVDLSINTLVVVVGGGVGSLK